MKRLYFLAAVILATASIAGVRRIEAVPISSATPVIVARGTLKNQTQPFSATIYTPSQDGLFRLSFYATITTADPNSSSDWLYGGTWTDVSGAITDDYNIALGFGNRLGEFYPYEGTLNLAGPPMTIQASKGTPITHSMTLQGPPDNSVYAFSYVLERLD